MEYEFQVMAKSLNEYGPPALAFIYVPEGSKPKKYLNIFAEYPEWKSC